MTHTLQRLLMMALIAGPFSLITPPQRVVAETIGECQAMAEENYPLVRRYDIVEKTP